MFSLSCWNVNSINARIETVIKYLKENSLDIICLQEIKCLDQPFPREVIEDLGYNVIVSGQKTYNGVAILSKFPIDEVITTLPNDPDDSQARYLEVVITIDGKVTRVASVYVPNGQEIASVKYYYKLKFLNALFEHTQELLSYDERVLVCGDFNIAPYDMDVFDADQLKETICFSIQEREQMRKFLYNGYHDAFRLINPEMQQYTWWDYRNNSWLQNKGMRIDHILLSPEAADCLKEVTIIKDMRNVQKASDHVPIEAKFI